MYCDRYFLLPNSWGDDDVITNRRQYQLVSITCLFLASKIHETRPAKLVDLTIYARRNFNRDEILCMERRLLMTLLSFLHPPNAGTFCLIFLSGFRSFPMSVSCAIDTCHFLIELAACGKEEGERKVGKYADTQSTEHSFFSRPWFNVYAFLFLFGPCYLP